MFEKEADEYRKNRKEQLINDDEFELLDNFDLNVGIAFKDGAEFGYNKAKEEMQEQGLALQSDMDKTIEQNIALKKQIEKLEKLVPKTCDNCVGYGCHAICVDCDFKDKWEIK